MTRGWIELFLLAIWLFLILLWTVKFRDERQRDFYHELMSDQSALRSGIVVSAILVIIQAVIGQLLYGIVVGMMWGFIISCAVHFVHRRRVAELKKVATTLSLGPTLSTRKVPQGESVPLR